METIVIVITGENDKVEVNAVGYAEEKEDKATEVARKMLALAKKELEG